MRQIFEVEKLMRAAISSNRIHSSLMAPNNMAAIFYYTGQYEEWFFAAHSTVHAKWDQSR